MLSIGTDDLASGLSLALLALVILGLIGSVMGIAAKRRGSTSVALDVAASVSFGWVVLCALGMLFSVWQTLSSSTISLSGDFGMAESTYWQREGAPDTLPALVSAYPTGAGVQIEGLPLGIRSLLLSTQLLTLALVALPAVVIRVMARHAAAGAPFAPRVAKTLWCCSIFVLATGVVRDLVAPIGQTLAVREVWFDGGPLSEAHTFILTVQIWPFAAALVLAALAAVFRHGYKLQKETEGLV